MELNKWQYGGIMYKLMLICGAVLMLQGCSYKTVTFVDQDGTNFTIRTIIPPFTKVDESSGDLIYRVKADGEVDIAVGGSTKGFDSTEQVSALGIVADLTKSVSKDKTDLAIIESNNDVEKKKLEPVVVPE